MVREKMLLLVLTAFLLATVSVSLAQQSDPMRRVGVLMYLNQNDPESETYLAAFREGLQKEGWIVGRNLEIEYRWTGGDPQLVRKYAAELQQTTVETNSEVAETLDDLRRFLRGRGTSSREVDSQLIQPA